MAEKVEFRKIRDFGEIIGDTFLFIKQNIKPLGKAFLYLCGIFILAGMVSSIVTQLQMVQLQRSIASGQYLKESYGSSPVWHFFFKFGIKYFLFIIFTILSYVSIYLTALSYIALYTQKGNIAPSVEEVWSYFKFYFLRLTGSAIVMTLFFALCFVCCIIPGIYVFPAVCLFYAVMILENGSFGYSYERSFKLLKNEWWITAAVILVVNIITGALTFIFQMPGFIISMISTFTHGERRISEAYAITTSVGQSLSMVFSIIPIVAIAFIYFNLVERKESSGLLSRIDALGNTDVNENVVQEDY